MNNKYNGIKNYLAVIFLGVGIYGCSSGGGNTVSPTSGSTVLGAVTGMAADSQGDIFISTTGNGSTQPDGSLYILKIQHSSASAANKSKANQLKSTDVTINANEYSVEKFSATVPDHSKITALAIDKDQGLVYAGTSGTMQNKGSVYVISKADRTWKLVGNGSMPDKGIVSGIVVVNGTIYVSSTGPGRRFCGHVYTLDDAGNWKLAGDDAYDTFAGRIHKLIADTKGNLYIVVNSIANFGSQGGKVYTKPSSSNSWQLVAGENVPNNGLIGAITVDSLNNVYIGTLAKGSTGGFIYKTGKEGIWQQVGIAIPDQGSINQIIVNNDDSNIYIASGGGDVYKMQNGSSSLFQIGGSAVPNSPSIRNLWLNTNSDILAATAGGNIYFAGKNQNTWTKVGV